MSMFLRTTEVSRSEAEISVYEMSTPPVPLQLCEMVLAITVCKTHCLLYAVVPGAWICFSEQCVSVPKFHRVGGSSAGAVPGCRLRCRRLFGIFGNGCWRGGFNRRGNGGRPNGNLLCCRSSRTRLCIGRQELRTGDARQVPCCNT